MRMKRKSLIEERYYGIKKRQMSFIKMVQERAVRMKTSWVPFLPNDLMFKVFLILPIKSLLRFTCVCKAWYKLIYSAEFVEAYNNHAKTTPIILRGVARNRPSTFHVETELSQAESFCLFPCSSGTKQSKFIHFLEIDNNKGKLIDLNISCSGSLVSSCNGLILITSMQEGLMKHRSSSLEQPLVGSQDNPGRLIVMNPMTRKLIGFPLGTLPSKFHDESYGLVFSHLEGVFKVVHLFKDKSGCIACEILSLQTRSWKAIDGPVATLFNKLGQAPISALGALHWLPGPSNSNYIISMRADDEKFSVTNLPMTMGTYDRLVEMGGSLSFVNSLDMDHIDVWILRGLEGTEWLKQHTIRIDAILGYVDNKEYSLPSFCLNAKEMVFRRKKRLYAYDFELEEIREIEMDHENIMAHENIITHSNNLATWEPLEPMS